MSSEVQLSVRVRHSDRYVSKRMPNWKQLTKRKLVAVYKQLVEELKKPVN